MGLLHSYSADVVWTVAGGSGKGVVGPAVNLTGDFTIEAWVNPKSDGLTSLRAIAGQWSQQGSNVDSYILALNNGQLSYFFGPYSAFGPMITGPAIPANTGSHVAVTRQGSTFRLFVNGAIVGTGTSTVPGPSIPTPFAMGDYHGTAGQFGAGGAASFCGYREEVRLTSVSRYNANFTPSPARFPAR